MDRYLDLLKLVLTDAIYDPDPRREFGLDHPARAMTMIGQKRLDNLQCCIESILFEDVPGDLVETGVWRGGATIFMCAMLEASGDQARQVWVCDSFCGLPQGDPSRYPADAGDTHHQDGVYAVSRADVENNFRRLGLLNGRVRFVEGWFKDTLPVVPIQSIAVLRLDGDMYESTMEALVHLYPKLSPGGYVIVDDYGSWANCRRAVENYRQANDINEPIQQIDQFGVFWCRK